MKQFIYADNAATTKLNKEAFNAMIPWLTDEYGNASQPYAFARKPKKALAESRKIIAKCINALPEEIYFTSGGTESDNWAIKGSASSDPDKRATITSAIEHHALLNACASIERHGYPVTYLSPDSEGTVDPEQLSAVITDRTRLVSIMFSNNEIGTIEPIAELARIAHSHGAIFHTDAVQAIAHTPIDVKAMGIDMLSASAHKFNGPKGIGFLYVRKGVELRPLNDGGAQEFGMRAGTENVASIVGMAKALEISCSALNENAEHILKLENALLERLKESGLDFVRNGARNHIPAINQRKKISFQKIEYNIKKERILHHGGERYTFSPYSLVWDGDNYYVVGYSDKYQAIGSHRVDRIAACPCILDESAVPQPVGFDVSKYIKTTFRMYNAPRAEVELLCDNSVMDAIIDRFGPDVQTYAGDLQNFRVIEEIAVGKVFFNWIFGFEGKVRIKGPESVKKQYREMVMSAMNLV